MDSSDEHHGYEPPEVVDIDAADDREFGVVPATVPGSGIDPP